MCIGASVFAYLVGSMASVASTMNSQDTAYNSKKALLRDYLEVRKVPRNMRKRIRDYSEYRWRKTCGVCAIREAELSIII